MDDERSGSAPAHAGSRPPRKGPYRDVVRTGSLKALRAGNRARLLSLLREQGAMHRAELARHAGLSRSAVTAIVAELLAEDLVVESTTAIPSAHPRDGRSGPLLTLNPRAGAAVGIDFSYDEVRIALADLAHTVLAERTCTIRPEQSWEQSLELATSVVQQMLDEAGVQHERVVGAGLGVPGPVDRNTQRIGLSSNSHAWVGAPAASELAARLQMPVAIDNTAHLGCLAELAWGSGVGVRDLVYLKLSTGIGSGIVVDGALVRGSVGAAGEMGHVVLDSNGPLCRCGNRGCLEAYGGMPAILNSIRLVLGAEATLDDAIAAALGGHRPAIRLFADVGEIIGRALAGVVNVLNPSRIVVGGDLASAGDLLLGPMRDSVRRHALAITGDVAKIVEGSFGRMAGALGGVALVLQDSSRLVQPAPNAPAVAANGALA